MGEITYFYYIRENPSFVIFKTRLKTYFIMQIMFYLDLFSIAFILVLLYMHIRI